MNPELKRALTLAISLVVIAAAICAIAQVPGCEAKAEAALPAPLERLCARLEAPGTPQWKRDLLGPIRERRIGRVGAVVTYYSPNNPADPLGGGAWGAWGVRLRKGHAAVGTSRRLAPYGSVVYCPGALDHLLVIVDCGPGVNREDRLDVCVPDTDEYRSLDARNWQTYPCWILGKVGKREAR